MNTRLIAVAVMLALNIVWLPSARADDVLVQARGLLDADRSDEAYVLLAAQYEQRASQPEYDLLLGTASLNSGRLFEAIFALERALEIEPNNAQARAAFGVAFYEMGENAAARREFMRLKTLPIPEALARRTDEYLSEIEAMRAGTNSPRFEREISRLSRHDHHTDFVPPWQVSSASIAIGRVEFASGNAVATDAAGQERILRRGDAVAVGDDLRTTANGVLQVNFANGGFVTLQPDSEYRIEEFQRPDQPNGMELVSYRLVKGCIRGITGKSGDGREDVYQIESAFAVLGIRGFGFNMRICDADCGSFPDGFYYKGWNSTTYVRTHAQEITISSGVGFYIKNIYSSIEVLDD